MGATKVGVQDADGVFLVPTWGAATGALIDVLASAANALYLAGAELGEGDVRNRVVAALARVRESEWADHVLPLARERMENSDGPHG